MSEAVVSWVQKMVLDVLERVRLGAHTGACTFDGLDDDLFEEIAFLHMVADSSAPRLMRVSKRFKFMYMVADMRYKQMIARRRVQVYIHPHSCYHPAPEWELKIERIYNERQRRQADYVLGTTTHVQHEARVHMKLRTSVFTESWYAKLARDR